MTHYPYPMTIAEREAARQRLREQVMAKARREEQACGRSMKCGGFDGVMRHAGAEGGCKNDGTTCLCECHDPTGADT